MAWALETNRKRIWLTGTKTLGRADFPAHASLSRKHIEVSVRKGSVFVKDMGSSNGTFVNGHKLASNMSSSLLDGDMIKIGGVELTLRFIKQRLFDRPAVTRVSIIASGCLSVFFYCARPSMDYSLALFPWPLLAIIAIAASSATVAGVIWTVVLRNKTWDLKLCRLFFMAVLVSNWVFAFLFVWMVEPDVPVSEWIDSTRLEYFCIDAFDSYRCRMTIADCPECANQLIRWKQDIVLKNLSLERSVFEQQIQQNRSPATQ